MRLAGSVGDVPAVEADRCRIAAGTRPEIERSVVDLPAPFAPTRATS
jgi:hypothetical protein